MLYVVQEMVTINANEANSLVSFATQFNPVGFVVPAILPRVKCRRLRSECLLRHLGSSYQETAIENRNLYACMM